MTQASTAPVCTHCGLPVPALRRASDVLNTLAAQFCCYGCRIAHQLACLGTDQPSGTPNTLLLRLGLGIFLSVNIMTFSYFFYSQDIYNSGYQNQSILASLFSYLLLLLCTGVIVTLGVPIFTDVLERWSLPGPRWRVLDSNLLILIGVLAGYGLSAAHTFMGSGQLYYETAAVILVLVTLGHYLDSVVRRRATLSAEACIDQLPQRAWRRQGGQTIEIDADQIDINDQLRVRPGEVFPADAAVSEGHSHVDESKLTGEACPRPVGPGETVLAGSINLDGALWITARSVGHDRVIAHMKRLLEEARHHQPAIQRVVDKVAAWFVPGVVALAIGVFGFHLLTGHAARGLFDGLSVLLISCPCALGLAAPLASWSAIGHALRLGVLFDSGATLERAAAVRRVLFDKTGTLTTPTMTLEQTHVTPGITEDQALAIAAAIETGFNHPIAHALVESAAQRNLALPQAQGVKIIPGLGVEAVVNSKRYYVGNAKLLGQTPENELKTGVHVYLTDGKNPLASFSLTECLRPDAAQSIQQLRHMHMDIQVLTGDQPGSAEKLGLTLAVPVHAQLLPSDKLTILERVRAQGKGPVAMVGDGINDGPVLAGADVGIAMADASELAKQAGHIRLLSNRIADVPLAFALARHAMRRIRLNLLWAFGYNVIGLALATAGYLTPVFAASSMFVSSLLIVTTSRGAGRIDRGT